MFLFEEVSASNAFLSKKIDESLWTVSEKFDAYFSHLHSLQKATQEDTASEKEASIERLKVVQSGVRLQIAALGSELEAIRAEMRSQNNAVASVTGAIDDLSKRTDAIDRAAWTTVDAMRQITADLGAGIEKKLGGISLAHREAMKDGRAAVSAAAKELRLRMDATDRALADSMNTIQRSGIRVVHVDDLILGVPAEEWRLAAYLRFHGIPEPGLVGFFRGLIRPGMTIVDVGASFGIFTLYAVKSLQGNGRLHSFEPTPRTYGLLRSNVQVNGFLEAGLVRFHEAAVTDSEGTAQLTTFADNSGHNTLFWQDAGAESVVVKTTRLDTALQSEPRVDVIKIDAEGAELSILQGMKATIANNPEIRILIEFAPIHLARANVTPEDFLEALKDLELEVSVVDDVTGALRTVPNQELVKAFSANLFLHRRIVTPGRTP
jgi:FkbM family methyltransferase